MKEKIALVEATRYFVANCRLSPKQLFEYQANLSA